eukprot:Tbor_TRINITY_DN7565_c0_g1::TRINITY_DN7565_c0_g1_i1::g.898::m.898/K03341/SEPSECS; O-phospho-L-seryl-tRNASec:L-selenocysteinyl-tRNA synthase
MDQDTLQSLTTTPSALVTQNHMRCALEALNTSHKLIRVVVHQRRLPDEAVPEATISLLLSQLAALDSNNFQIHAGVGEREGRVYSSLVRQRHCHFSHGVGRSGELNGHQPKAAGSSLLYTLTNHLALDVLRAAGLENKRVVEEALVMPLATGMALTIVLMSIAHGRSGGHSYLPHAEVGDNKRKDSKETDEKNGNSNSNHLMGKYVVWCRIDQKTCLKSITAAGLEPVVVNLRRATDVTRKSTGKENTTKKTSKKTTKKCSHIDKYDDGTTSFSTNDKSLSQEMPKPAPQGDDNTPTTDRNINKSPQYNNNKYFLQSDANDVKEALETLPGGPNSAACVVITTSCFAPRLPDDPLAISRVCKELNVPLVINNAYGVQSPAIMKRINTATIHGRVDCVVQSTDKNFMVPVGGAVICGPSAVVRGVSSLYPGRASATPIMDLFVTLLEMGKHRYLALAHTERAEMRLYFLSKLEVFCVERGESVVFDERNDVSFGVTLRNAWKVRGKVNGNLKDANKKDKLKGGTNNKNLEKQTPPTPTPHVARETGDHNEYDEYIEMHKAAIDIGSKLYHLGVSGPRVVSTLQSSKTVGGINFGSYGMHGYGELQHQETQEEEENKRASASSDIYGNCSTETHFGDDMNSYGDCPQEKQEKDQQTQQPSIAVMSVPPMLIFACAIGITHGDIDIFLGRLVSLYPPPVQ